LVAEEEERRVSGSGRRRLRVQETLRNLGDLLEHDSKVTVT